MNRTPSSRRIHLVLMTQAFGFNYLPLHLEMDKAFVSLRFMGIGSESLGSSGSPEIA